MADFSIDAVTEFVAELLGAQKEEAKEMAGVIGWPVTHSLSPKLHNHWLELNDINGKYVALPVEAAELGAVIRSLPSRGWKGCNVTIPHKEAVIPFLDDIDETARAIGAVNTIIISDSGKLHGTNTDAYGFAENIRAHLGGTKKAVALGAGGAAKAVWKALADLGFEEVVVSNRTAEKLEGAQNISSKTKFSICPWEEREVALSGADLLVNCTSLGLAGADPLKLDLTNLPVEALVTDIVYKPLETGLLAAAKARGNKTVDGLGMLIYQAIPGFESWFGVRPAYEDNLKTLLLA